MDKKLYMEIMSFIGDRVFYDSTGQKILGVNMLGETQILLDVRGWGAIQNLFSDKKGAVDIERASAFQDEIGEWIVDAINKKLRDKKPYAESAVMQIVREIYPNEKLVISKFGLQANLTLINEDTQKEQTSALPMDHHLDTERVIDVVKYLHKKIE